MTCKPKKYGIPMYQSRFLRLLRPICGGYLEMKYSLFDNNQDHLQERVERIRAIHPNAIMTYTFGCCLPMATVEY